MSVVSILPADTYTVVNKTILNENDNKILTMLYQPIIGITAINLYMTLCFDLDKNEIMSDEVSHHHLMTNMRTKLEDIIIAREKLEAIGLLKSYFKKSDDVNNYIYEIFSPLSAKEIFSHPILNIVLYNNVGKKEYERLVNIFKVPRINYDGFEDITKNFDEVFDSVSGTMFENSLKDIKTTHKLNINIDNEFDFELLESIMPKGLLSDKALTRDIKTLIQNLSFVYNLEVEEIKNLIINSVGVKHNIDKTLLRKNARNYYQFNNSGKLPSLIYQKQPEYLKSATGDDSKRAKMIYTFESVDPYHFLKSKYNGVKPTSRDLNMIESLMNDLELKPAVVNVLIDYVLRINNNKLTKNFIETIAGQWKRLNIETAEDAMNQAYKESKKKTKTTNINNKEKQKEIIPEWFNKNIEKQKMTKEEEDEVKGLLKDFV
ncbi:MAG: DnaD domain protein [Bacilli bacterium]|nr:DnaD domain protein [Bacilli bacterium]